MRRLRLLLPALILFISAIGIAQSPDWATAAVSIPDLAGLTPPQAAAVLNAGRLQLGILTSTTADVRQTAGTIATQFPAPGSTISMGAAVDVVIAYAPNIRLIYDNNDLTLINMSQQQIDLRTITLRATEGVPVYFEGARWGRRIEPNDCVQVWSIRRTRPKSLPECRRIEAWLSTTDVNQHVWKDSAGVQRFMLQQNDIVRGDCPAAGTGTRDEPLICEMYLDQNQTPPLWPFLHLAYTADTLVIHNTSSDSWMRLSAAVKPAMGGAFSFSDLRLYKAIDRLVISEASGGGNVLRQLAPGQCARFRTPSAPVESLPEPCLLFADAIVESMPFWSVPFTVEEISGAKHTCDAAAPKGVTTCLVLR